MKKFIDGHARFLSEIYPEQQGMFEHLSSGQNPEALFITCADSRVVPGLITQTSPGDIFVCRNVGNIVPPFGEFTGGVSSAIEYGVMALGVKHIVVLGHSDCGAMKALMNPGNVKSMPTVAQWLKHAETAAHVVEHNHPGLEGDAKLAALTQENVVAQLDHLQTHPSVAARVRKGQLQLHGWVYQIHSGRIDAWDGQSFRPLAEEPFRPLTPLLATTPTSEARVPA